MPRKERHYYKEFVDSATKIILHISNIRRYEKVISQNELADLAGVSRSTYSLFESHKRDLRFNTVAKIIDALDYELILRQKNSPH